MIDTSKKFLVAGAGKSGIGSVNLLLKTGADVRAAGRQTVCGFRHTP